METLDYYLLIAKFDDYVFRLNSLQLLGSWLTIPWIMLENDQTYYKNLSVFFIQKSWNKKFQCCKVGKSFIECYKVLTGLSQGSIHYCLKFSKMTYLLLLKTQHFVITLTIILYTYPLKHLLRSWVAWNKSFCFLKNGFMCYILHGNNCHTLQNMNHFVTAVCLSL